MVKMEVLKHWIFRPIKKRVHIALFKILSRLDEGFVLNSTRQITLATEAGQRIPIPGSETAVEDAPVVVNEDGLIVGEKTLYLTLSSFFGKGELTKGQRELLEFLTQKKNSWINHEELLKAAIVFAEDKSRSTHAEVALEGAELLFQLRSHQDQTRKNRLAYTLQEKDNPQAVFWPNPTSDKPTSLFHELPWARSFKFIDRATPIGSAGSCFAMEIAHRLQRDGYNYVITEPYPNASNGLSNSCARWGIIFNTPSFRQLVERAFGVRSLPKIVWSMKRAGKIEILDPFREDIVFSSIEEYAADLPKHIAAARDAFIKAKVFVLTLGVNEVWKLKTDNSVFSRAPWRIASNLTERKVMTVEENLHELQTMLDLWRKFNPEVKIILSVSPVPLHATFRGDEYHVISANAHSKATLRVVAEEFVRRNKNVYYFPSYETVMYCTEGAWHKDQRHVSREAVDNVMHLFGKMFLSEFKEK
jgi:GSCFA family